MNPLALIAIIQAAMVAAGPALQAMIAAAEVVGADVAAHRDAMTTFQDALAKLETVFQVLPLPVKPQAA